MGRFSGLRTTTMFYSAVGGVFLATMHAQAADVTAQPKKAPQFTATRAVDGVNTKFDAFGGTMANKSFAATRGVFTVPLGDSYGLQLDGMAGSFDQKFYGVARRRICSGAIRRWRWPGFTPTTLI